MRINIYQIDGEKDSRRVKFDGYEHTLKNGGIDPSIYKCTFHGYVDAQGLDDIYSIFNFF